MTELLCDSWMMGKNFFLWYYDKLIVDDCPLDLAIACLSNNFAVYSHSNTHVWYVYMQWYQSNRFYALHIKQRIWKYHRRPERTGNICSENKKLSNNYNLINKWTWQLECYKENNKFLLIRVMMFLFSLLLFLICRNKNKFNATDQASFSVWEIKAWHPNWIMSTQNSHTWPTTKTCMFMTQ